MSKFVETEFVSTKEILKFPDHYVAMAVMVDDAGVEADENGRKIVKKGTIVGGKAKSAIDNVNEPICNKYFAAVAASKIFGTPGDDSAITFTAKTPGTAGNDISITITDPGTASQQLSVTVGGTENKDIIISLATGTDGNEVSTAAEVAEAVNGHSTAKNLVVATAHGDGEGVVAAATKTQLTGGAAGSATGAEGVLLNDVDVTYGDKEGAMIIHGFVKIDALPYGTNNADAATAAGTVLDMVKFIK